ncbi:MAG: SLC13 family permease [Anaerolineae bacterium]|nr:SLC13 family permease [Anaerolineae bacterium]
MTHDMWIALGILVAAIVLFVTEWLRVDVVAIGVMVALMLSGLLTTDEALSGFSNSAVLTIAALFIVGGAVLQTGLADLIGRRILSIAGGSEWRLIAVIMAAVALLSGFMSDTGTVAVLLPAIVSLAGRAQVNPSRLLIPLSFGSLLGGATTLIGTPPNLIVSDLLREEGLIAFEFFDYTPIGLILLVGGILFMLSIGRWLLPDRKRVQELQRVETAEELVDLYRLPDNLFHLRVRRGSPLVGQTVVEADLGRAFHISVLEIQRPGQPRSLIKVGGQRLTLQPDSVRRMPRETTPIAADDVLVVQGYGTDVSHAAAHWNLALQPVGVEEGQSLVDYEAGIAEILLPPRSSLVGKTLVETRFGSTYNLTVLAINRAGGEGDLNLKETRLQAGDTLLVQGTWRSIVALKKRRRDFVVMGEPQAMAGAPARRRAPIALLVLAGMLVLMITNAVSVAAAAMVAALAMILSGCVTIDEAYEAVDWKSIVLIAGMLPMSIALEKVGLVSLVAEGLVGSVGNLGPLAVLGGLFVLTSAFTQVLSNTATTVLVAPIALAAARQLAVQPYAFLMTVAIAASMAFASPVASPVNTLVMAAGKYQFRDYLKVGVPLILITLILSVIFLPFLWPL